jgi:hypothetical protein
MFKSEDGYSLTPNLPNKKSRILPKLYELQKSNPDATLKDVVEAKHVRYGVKQKLSKFSGREVTGAEIEKAIFDKFNTFKVSPEVFEEYKQFIIERSQEIYRETSEEIQNLTLRISGARSDLNKYVTLHMGYKKNTIEQEIYDKKTKEYEAKIIRLQKQCNELGKTERHTYVEYEMFLDVMNRANDYYKRANFVQKAKITDIFFLNIVLDSKKNFIITPKPIFEALFETISSKYKKKSRKGISFGADDETRTRNQLLGRQ